MAIRFAVANGVWSNTATWNGGTLPTAADDVFSNNFTINIDQDITAITLRNTSNVSPAITQGGGFNVTGSTGTRIITLTGTRASVSFTNSGLWIGAAGLFVISATSGATVTINSPLGNPNTNIGSVFTIIGNATVNYSGIMTQPAPFNSAIIVQNTAANGTLNVVGNPIGSSNEQSGINILAPGYTCNIVGNLIGGNNAGNGAPSAVQLGAATTLNVTGNVTAAGTAGFGISVNVAGSVVNVTGNVTAAAVAGITSTVNHTTTINGNVTASSAAVGISSTNTSATITVNGNLTNVADITAVYSPKMRISPTAQQAWTFQTAGPNRQIFTANAFSGGTVPAASDVRLGISYAGGSLTGTCAVPSANSVAFGVPVDATTGTSLITRAQFLTDLGTIAAGYPQI